VFLSYHAAHQAGGDHMNQITIGIFFAGGLMAGMILLMEVGRHIGHRRSQRDEQSARAGLGAIEGSVFALLGLLIAFTFTGAAGRFDHRRDLIAQEVNAIGTAWLRLDLVEPQARASLQDLFRRYLDGRLEAYRMGHDYETAKAKLAEAAQLQQSIWDEAFAATQASPDRTVVVVLLPALNAMFDIASMRTMTLQIHPPMIMFIMLGLCALLAALMAGYAMSRGSRSWTHIIVFSLVMAGSVYIIIDMEFPRLGLVRVDSFDQNLIDLRTGMDAAVR
jgi:hypothetical protein